MHIKLKMQAMCVIILSLAFEVLVFSIGLFYDIYVNSPCKGSVKKWGRGSGSLFSYLVKELFIKTGEGVWQPLLISSKGSVKKF